MSDTLFDLEPDDQAEDDELDLRDGDDAWTSCRVCHLLSTAAGIVRWEHGLVNHEVDEPGDLPLQPSDTCARYIFAGSRQAREPLAFASARGAAS